MDKPSILCNGSNMQDDDCMSMDSVYNINKNNCMKTMHLPVLNVF